MDKKELAFLAKASTGVTVCGVYGCGRPVYAKMVCLAHYRMRRRQIKALIASGEKPENAEHMYRLTPLRKPHGQVGEKPLTQTVSIRVCDDTAAYVRRDVAGARQALDDAAANSVSSKSKRTANRKE